MASKGRNSDRWPAQGNWHRRGERDGDETNHAGIVEYGFSRRDLAELLVRARPLVFRQAPLRHAANLDVFWLEPRLVALVMYLEQVSGRLREPVFRGLIEADGRSD